MKSKLKLITICHLLSAICLSAFGQGTAFTYQGRLNSGTNPATGSYDLTFALFSTSSGAGQVGSTITNPVTSLSNGLFTVTLDFGNQFPGPDRWLEIAVRTNGAAGFTTLSPREKLTPAPYSIFAENVGAGGLTAGTYGNAVTLNNSANSFAGNGSGLANVNALTLGGVGSNGFWRTTGNAGTTPGVNYLGTTDNQALEIQVNGIRALRIEPTAAPSLVAGYFQNSANGFAAATIAGGGTSGSPNYIFGNYGFVGAGHGGQAGSFSAVVDGGYNVAPGQFSFIGSGLRITNLANYSFIGSGSNNVIENDSDFSVIGGGQINVIQTNSPFAVISGGVQNNIGVSAGAATIAGGTFNTNEIGASSSSIGGGDENLIQLDASHAVIGGGLQNTVGPHGYYSTIGGGRMNTIGNSATSSTISGGDHNTLFPGYTHSTISGGYNNIIAGHYATVLGGANNTAVGDYSIAAGENAYVNHQGSFVWADSQGSNFTSTAVNQFNVRAANGLRVSDGAKGNIVVQPLNDGNTGFQAFNFNGYYDFSAGGEQRFNTNKTRWRLVVDQRSTSDLMTIDNFNGTTVSSFIAILTNGFVGMGTTSPTNKLHVIGGATFSSGAGGGNQNVVWIPGSASWSFTSDRNTKDRIQPVDAQSVLEKVSRVPIAEWSYIGYDQRHIGPMAQDFHEQFPLNNSDKTLNDADLHGVALAAIQGLNQKMDSENANLREELKRRDAENAELKQRLEVLERIVLEQKSN